MCRACNFLSRIEKNNFLHLENSKQPVFDEIHWMRPETRNWVLRDFRAEEKVVGFSGGEADQRCSCSGGPSCPYGELWGWDGPSGGKGLDLCIPESAHCWQLATHSGGLTLRTQCPAAGWGPSP